MRKKFEKVCAVMLAGSMVLSMAGCGKGKDNNQKTDETTPTEAAASDDSAAKTDDSTSTEATTAPTEEAAKSLADYPKVDSFNYYNIAAGVTDEELNASPMAKLVEDYTGYKVTYTQAPADPVDGQTAVTNVFMLKQDYQAVKVSKDQFYTLLASNALLPITEYVNGSTNLKSCISDFGWETATKDGEIYAIPQKGAKACSNVGLCYRVDWLNEYNAANPSTAIPVPSEENGYSMGLTDFKTMLEYFKTKVPDGGYAMAVDYNTVFQENIMPAFGIYQDWQDVDGKLTYIINQPGFADYAAYMEGLFDEDLILYQATSNDAGAVKSLQSRNVGVGRAAHWNAYAIETTNAAEGTDLSQYTDDTIGYIKVLVPDDAVGDASKAIIKASEGYGYYTVVPNFATPEQAAAVVDFADKKLDNDFYLKLVLGTEGETFTVKDGAYYPILPQFNDLQGLSDKFIDGSREDVMGDYWLCRTRKTAAQDKIFSAINYDITVTTAPTVVMPPNEAYDTYFNAASTEVKNAIVTTMFQKDAPFDLQAIQDKWVEFEGNTITDSVNSWYSTWDLKDATN